MSVPVLNQGNELVIFFKIYAECGYKGDACYWCQDLQDLIINTFSIPADLI